MAVVCLLLRRLVASAWLDCRCPSPTTRAPPGCNRLEARLGIEIFIAAPEKPSPASQLLLVDPRRLCSCIHSTARINGRAACRWRLDISDCFTRLEYPPLRISCHLSISVPTLGAGAVHAKPSISQPWSPLFPVLPGVGPTAGCVVHSRQHHHSLARMSEY